MAEPTQRESVATTEDSSPDTDRDFDPTAEMLVDDYDDERTMDEEEAMSEGDSMAGDELNDLQKEGDMPMEELLAMYGARRPHTPPPAPTTGNTSSDNTPIKPNSSGGRGAVEGNGVGPGVKGPVSEESGCQDEWQNVHVVPSQTVRLLRSDHLIMEGSSDEDDEEEEEEDDDDEDFEPQHYENWKKTIQVGQDYQTVVPEGLCPYADNTPVFEDEDRLLWSPYSLDDSAVEAYLSEYHNHNISTAQGVHAVPTGGHTWDDEQALYLALSCSYNLVEALRRHKTQPSTAADPMSLWTEDECRSFESGLRTFGKDFFQIKQNKVRSRSVLELVQFYYLWKKTERHDAFAARTRLEKRKYSLHPGITDYMDRFLDEQENPLDGGERASARNSSSQTTTGSTTTGSIVLPTAAKDTAPASDALNSSVPGKDVRAHLSTESSNHRSLASSKPQGNNGSPAIAIDKDIRGKTNIPPSGCSTETSGSIPDIAAGKKAIGTVYQTVAVTGQEQTLQQQKPNSQQIVTAKFATVEQPTTRLLQSTIRETSSDSKQNDATVDKSGAVNLLELKADGTHSGYEKTTGGTSSKPSSSLGISLSGSCGFVGTVRQSSVGMVAAVIAGDIPVADVSKMAADASSNDKQAGMKSDVVAPESDAANVAASGVAAEVVTASLTSEKRPSEPEPVATHVEKTNITATLKDTTTSPTAIVSATCPIMEGKISEKSAIVSQAPVKALSSSEATAALSENSSPAPVDSQSPQDVSNAGNGAGQLDSSSMVKSCDSGKEFDKQCVEAINTEVSDEIHSDSTPQSGTGASKMTCDNADDVSVVTSTGNCMIVKPNTTATTDARPLLTDSLQISAASNYEEDAKISCSEAQEETTGSSVVESSKLSSDVVAAGLDVAIEVMRDETRKLEVVALRTNDKTADAVNTGNGNVVKDTAVEQGAVETVLCNSDSVAKT